VEVFGLAAPDLAIVLYYFWTKHKKAANIFAAFLLFDQF
jgi:hypothetical protein